MYLDNVDIADNLSKYATDCIGLHRTT